MAKRGPLWTETALDKARKLKSAGMTYEEIGAALDRTGAAVRDALQRHTGLVTNHPYLKSYDGPPIGFTDEDTRLRINAIEGSAKLKAEILRVFA
jgi:hypothetical protein